MGNGFAFLDRKVEASVVKGVMGVSSRKKSVPGVRIVEIHYITGEPLNLLVWDYTCEPQAYKLARAIGNWLPKVMTNCSGMVMRLNVMGNRRGDLSQRNL